MSGIVERLRRAWPRPKEGALGDLHEAADEIERLTRELSEARRKAFEEAGQKAREYAAHYPEASDGRNTFIIFAEWAEGRS